MFIYRCIKRMIFYTLMKPTLKDDGEKEMKIVSTSLALQIGGRAGRYGTEYQEGEVTTFRKDDLILLKDLIQKPLDNIEVSYLD
jgi:ATP-dependent RNA helicase SUPV3L1/SUV3